MSKTKKRNNEARKRLFEYKGEVTLPDGTTSRKSFYSPISKEDAKQRWRDHVNPPLRVVAAEGTFAWYFLHKFTPTKAHLAENSRSSIQDAARHVLPELGDVPMATIDVATVCTMLSRLEQKETLRNRNAKPRARKGKDGQLVLVPPKRIFKKLGPSMVNKCRRIALECHALACELDPKLRPINPRRVPVRKESLPEVVPYTPWQMRRLLEASEGTIAHLAVLLYFFLGVTLREGVGTMTTDLDAAGVLHIRRQSRRKGEGTTTTLKTEYRGRDLPLPPGLLEEIRAYAFGEGRLMRTYDPETKAYHPINAHSVNKSLRTAMKRAALHPMTAHKGRHCFSSWLDDNGCPRSVRLALMGHSRKAVQDRYNHPRLMREWLGRLWEASFVPDVEEVPDYEYEPVHLGPKIPARGQAHGRSVLTEEKVRDIRDRLARKESTLSIARHHGVSWKTIKSIETGKTWSHVA